MTVDSVVVRRGSSARRLTVDEFVALPLDVRIAHILQRELTFFEGEREVDPDVALRSLRELKLRG